MSLRGERFRRIALTRALRTAAGLMLLASVFAPTRPVASAFVWGRCAIISQNVSANSRDTAGIGSPLLKARVERLKAITVQNEDESARPDLRIRVLFYPPRALRAQTSWYRTAQSRSQIHSPLRC